MSELFSNAIQSVPRGPWAVGVSGGADSVALLRLLRDRPDLTLHVVHLNHEARGGESDADAAFVRELAERWGLAHTIERRSNLETDTANLPRNVSARYRRLRITLFRRVVQSCGLNGVLLAHHADDQAETILLRLLRGSGYSGLSGMRADSVIGDLRCLRPLLKVDRAALVQWLRDIDQPWREDSSNASPKYLRNRLRPMLANDPSLRDALLELGTACETLQAWETSAMPRESPVFEVNSTNDLPQIIARAVAKRWLIAAGVAPDEIEPATVKRLLEMCFDAAAPARMQFPGGITIARRRGKIERVSSS